MKQPAGLQVGLVGSWVVRRPPVLSIGRCQLDTERLGDCGRRLVFDFQEIVVRHVVALAPQGCTV